MTSLVHSFQKNARDDNSHVHISNRDTFSNAKPMKSCCLLDISPGTSNKHFTFNISQAELSIFLREPASPIGFLTSVKNGNVPLPVFKHSELSFSQFIRKYFLLHLHNMYKCQQLLTSHPFTKRIGAIIIAHLDCYNRTCNWLPTRQPERSF